MGRLGYVPSLQCAEFVMGRVCHVPSLLCAELSLNRQFDWNIIGNLDGLSLLVNQVPAKCHHGMSGRPRARPGSTTSRHDIPVFLVLNYCL